MNHARPSRVAAFAALLSLLFFACAIDEDLRINADGSGTYRLKITIPEDLASDLGTVRTDAAKEGFTVVEEGRAGKDRFAILRKDFTDVTALNDSNSRFALTITKMGWLRREYRLDATLQPVGYGSFKRHIAVTMPGKISASDHGEIDGSRVRWDATTGGSIHITAGGYAIPFSRAASTLIIVATIAGLALLIARRKHGADSRPACATCHAPLVRGARFCADCGTGAPAAQI
ncbi:MAG: zinc ribbon domain-containing protein [Acidobacteria bacterium]|nr:zinc ribbon domain-containing protein [Acidobacteriota bacterium]MBV9476826.1 zinc ribbon domain-containing protein [Acidobacteriota bacterium]